MPRIQISQKAAKSLKVAAAMQDKRPHALMEELIMRHCATQGQVATEPEKPCAHMLAKPDGHESTEPQHAESPESRRIAPAEVAARKGRPWKGGPPPFEEQHPEIAARALALWAGGKRAGGMSRDAVAAKMCEEGIEISAAQVEKIAKRARKKNI